MVRSRFRGNGAAGYYGYSSFASPGTGGAIYIKFSTADVSHCQFHNNWVSAGGSEKSIGGAVASKCGVCDFGLCYFSSTTNKHAIYTTMLSVHCVYVLFEIKLCDQSILFVVLTLFSPFSSVQSTLTTRRCPRRAWRASRSSGPFSTTTRLTDSSACSTDSQVGIDVLALSGLYELFVMIVRSHNRWLLLNNCICLTLNSQLCKCSMSTIDCVNLSLLTDSLISCSQARAVRLALWAPTALQLNCCT